MRLWGGAGGVSGTWLEVCPGCGWGAPVSIWGADGSEVLCFRRWEEVWVEMDDRIMGFRCDT